MGDDYIDLLKVIGIDMSIQICMCLDDPSDLVRLCLVSHSFRKLVIANALLKQLCLRMFPEMSSISHVIEEMNMIEPLKMESNNSMESDCLEKNHKLYTYLAHCLLTSGVNENCISIAYRASSTDNFPQECIQNTLVPGDRTDTRASYWSSKGADDPSTPETLVYKLITDLCVITEIQIQPFEAYFQNDFPIYASKAVRFHMGHSKQPVDIERAFYEEPVEDFEIFDRNFIWSYTSPEFTMAQVKMLQKFKLPKPVVCIGGILKVELLGRVQRQEIDSLYYVCVSHVQAIGRPLLQSYDLRMDYESGKFMLREKIESSRLGEENSIGEESGSISSPFHLQVKGARLERLIHSSLIHSSILENNVAYDDDEEDAVYMDGGDYEDGPDVDDDEFLL